MFRERLNAIEKSLADVAASQDPVQVASLAIDQWQSIHAYLSKIIGPRGVCALYQRSTHSTLLMYPWLAPVYDHATDSGDFDFLRAAFVEQPGSVIAACQVRLMETFLDVLSRLIGESLAGQLLVAALSQPRSGSTPGAKP